MADDAIRVDAFTVGARKFVLKEPISLEIHKEGPLWCYEYPPLRMTVSSFNKDAAMKQFSQEFQSLWEEYGSAPDDTLGAEGLDLKRKLIDLVDRVE
jgi:hypothetical protein